MLYCSVDTQDLARSATVAAFVTFHYRVHTMQFLNSVLSNLSEFYVGRMHVTVVTNVDDLVEKERIEKLCRNYFPNHSYEIASFPDLHLGSMLTWKHKPLLRAAVQANYSHFIYLEDDIDLTFGNFLYFLHFADVLREYGLVPSFLRTEFNHEAGEIRSTDAVHSTPINKASLIEVRGQMFASPRFPYCASYVLNRNMADEYLASKSFDYEKSIEMSQWGIPERAAMGVCWENPPKGYSHRYVLPVSPDLVPMPFCQTAHMPSNYTNAESIFGRLEVNKLFKEET